MAGAGVGDERPRDCAPSLHPLHVDGETERPMGSRSPVSRAHSAGPARPAPAERPGITC